MFCIISDIIVSCWPAFCHPWNIRILIDWLIATPLHIAHALRGLWAIADFLITLRVKLNGAVYCNRLCPWVCSCVCVFVCVCLWDCCHDNSKSRALIFTKLGLYVKVMTVSSWLNFGRPAPPGREFAAGQNFCFFFAPPYYSQRAVFASLWAHF